MENTVNSMDALDFLIAEGLETYETYSGIVYLINGGISLWNFEYFCQNTFLNDFPHL